MRHLLPDGWSRPRGYSNGIQTEGSFVFVAGMVGWNEAGVFPADFAGQFEQTLKNIVAVLAAADAGPEHVVRMTWYVTDLSLYKANIAEVGKIYKSIMGKNFPVMAVLGISELVEEKAFIEIETTAVIS